MALPSFEFTFLAASFAFNENGTVLQNNSLINCARDCANSVCVGFGYRASTKKCYRLAHINQDCSSCINVGANLYTFIRGRRCYEQQQDYSRWGDACYTAENTTATWDGAQTICGGKGGFLFEVTSNGLHDFFRKIVFADRNGSRVWIGGKCVKDGQNENIILEILSLFGRVTTSGSGQDSCLWFRNNETIDEFRWLPDTHEPSSESCLHYAWDLDLYSWDQAECAELETPIYCQFPGP